MKRLRDMDLLRDSRWGVLVPDFKLTFILWVPLFAVALAFGIMRRFPSIGLFAIAMAVGVWGVCDAGVRVYRKTQGLKSKSKGALLALFGVALLFVGLWVAMGVRVGIWTYHDYERYFWLTTKLEVAHRLWRGDIKAGDDAEKLAAMWHPHQLGRFGRWIKMDWFPYGRRKDSISFIGVTVVAKDGVLVRAEYWSDDGVADRDFFNTLTPAAETEYRVAFNAYGDGLRAERKKYIPTGNGD